MPFGPDDVGDYVGFVYQIYNETNGRSYIGKKLFTKAKSYQKNGKRKSKRVQSDWQSYTGSNDELNADIKKGDKITKVILALCTSKGWMTYHETKLILQYDCLIKDQYYNSWVQCKIRRSHLK